MGFFSSYLGTNIGIFAAFTAYMSMILIWNGTTSGDAQRTLWKRDLSFYAERAFSESLHKSSVLLHGGTQVLRMDVGNVQQVLMMCIPGKWSRTPFSQRSFHANSKASRTSPRGRQVLTTFIFSSAFPSKRGSVRHSCVLLLLLLPLF